MVCSWKGCLLILFWLLWSVAMGGDSVGLREVDDGEDM